MSRRCRWIVLLGALLCVLAGCGGKVENSINMSVTIIEPIRLATAEPLSFASEENTNLAGLLQQSAGDAFVCIEAGGLAGSGMIYGTAGQDLLVITAAHVLEQAEGAVRISFVDGTNVYSDQYLAYEEKDLAIIAVDCSKLPEKSVENYKALLIEDEKFELCGKEDTCITMGGSEIPGSAAYEGSLLAAWMYLEDYGFNMTVAQGICDPGMSGGGLFDSRGYFLGVLSGFDEEGRIAVVPLPTVRETVHDFLNNSL